MKIACVGIFTNNGDFVYDTMMDKMAERVSEDIYPEMPEITFHMEYFKGLDADETISDMNDFLSNLLKFYENDETIICIFFHGNIGLTAAYQIGYFAGYLQWQKQIDCQGFRWNEKVNAYESI